jgi:hypothetical protein
MPVRLGGFILFLLALDIPQVFFDFFIAQRLPIALKSVANPSRARITALGPGKQTMTTAIKRIAPRWIV